LIGDDVIGRWPELNLAVFRGAAKLAASIVTTEPLVSAYHPYLDRMTPDGIGCPLGVEGRWSSRSS
jgi:hypothetical protein